MAVDRAAIVAGGGETALDARGELRIERHRARGLEDVVRGVGLAERVREARGVARGLLGAGVQFGGADDGGDGHQLFINPRRTFLPRINGKEIPWPITSPI